MAIFIVRIGCYLKRGRLRTAFGIDCFALRILLRDEGLNLQFAELQIGFYAEERLRTADER